MATLTGRNIPQVNDESGTASVTSATDIFAIDTTGVEKIAVQVTSAGSATITYECSNDNSTWVGVSGYTPAAPATETVATSTTAALWVFRCEARYFRARVSAYTSGTVTVVWRTTARV
jgi:N-methylhydantoinase B/oxoprolinase/acetone carboxylase alpha subunit